MKRRFNRSERFVLFTLSGGKCALCGRALGQGWHADHVDPYSKGGATSLSNGQALCSKCNQSKGARQMSRDTIRYRPVQERALFAVDQRVFTIREIMAQGRKPTAREKTIVLWLDPGSGKSLTALAAVNKLYRMGFIYSAAWFTPRLNLCGQAELDWGNEFAKYYADPKMGDILYRQNNPPLVDFAAGQFGYVSTYQSLVKSPGVHLQFAAQNRFALIADEAQILGYDPDESSGTQAARWITDMAEEASIILLLTGTPYRQDGRQLTLATYTPPDSEGRIYLEHDVRGTYTEGVHLGYLRKFDAHLVDGRALYQYLDGDTEEVHLSKIDSGFFRVVEAPEYYEGVVDKAIESILEFQKTYREFRGLIACNRQRHAERILEYINRRYPHLKALIAISDINASNDNLRLFKNGGYDILVSVGMAHMGYDCKHISTVCYLGAIRDENWLRQLFARGMRAVSDPNAPRAEDQFVRVIVPDDPLMTKVIHKIRTESEEGLKLREKPEEDTDRIRNPPEQLRLGSPVESEITRIHALGNDPKHDVDYEEYEALEEARQKHGLGLVPFTGLKAFLSDFGFTFNRPKQPLQPLTRKPMPPRTDLEKRKTVKGLIKKVQDRCNHYMVEADLIPETERAWAQKQTILAKGSRQKSEESLSKLLDVLAWVNETLVPYVERQTGKTIKREHFVDDHYQQS